VRGSHPGRGNRARVNAATVGEDFVGCAETVQDEGKPVLVPVFIGPTFLTSRPVAVGSCERIPSAPRRCAWLIGMASSHR